MVRLELGWPIDIENNEHSSMEDVLLMQKTGNELREQYGPNVLACRVFDYIKDKPNVVIDSIRNIYEIEKLKELSNFKLVAISAKSLIRYGRCLRRGRIYAENYVEFLSVEKKECSIDKIAQNLNGCIDLADFVLLNNYDVLEDYYDYLNYFYDKYIN